MTDFIKVKHSFNAGDLLTIMPGLKQLSLDTGKKFVIYQNLNFPSYYYDNQVNSTVDANGKSVCMNTDIFRRMKPLIEFQDYIQSFEVWEGQEVDLNYDITRDRKSIPMPYGDIHTWAESVFPQTSTDLSKPSITIGNPKYEYLYANKIIVNRTQRYTNPYVTYHFLKPFEKDILFSGTKMEHQDFCLKNKIDVELLETVDFLELAQAILTCRFGVYNQSLHWHIADSIKTKRVLEVCAMFPNTFTTGANGYNSFNQESLEYYFHKLINQ